MSDVIKNSTLFVRETIARIQGDDNKAIALHNERVGGGAIKAEIALQEGVILVKKETAVALAEEELNNAIYPTTKISNTETYTRSIREKQEALQDAKDDLEATKQWIVSIKQILSEKY